MTGVDASLFLAFELRASTACGSCSSVLLFLWQLSGYQRYLPLFYNYIRRDRYDNWALSELGRGNPKLQWESQDTGNQETWNICWRKLQELSEVGPKNFTSVTGRKLGRENRPFKSIGFNDAAKSPDAKIVVEGSGVCPAGIWPLVLWSYHSLIFSNIFFIEFSLWVILYWMKHVTFKKLFLFLTCFVLIRLIDKNLDWVSKRYLNFGLLNTVEYLRLWVLIPWSLHYKMNKGLWGRSWGLIWFVWLYHSRCLMVNFNFPFERINKCLELWKGTALSSTVRDGIN